MGVGDVIDPVDIAAGGQGAGHAAIGAPPADLAAEVTFPRWMDAQRLAVRVGLKQVALCDVKKKQVRCLFDEAMYREAAGKAGIANAGKRQARHLTPSEASVAGKVLWVRVAYDVEGKPRVAPFGAQEYWRLFPDRGEAKLAWAPAPAPRAWEFQDISPCGRYLLVMRYVRQNNMDRQVYFLVDGQMRAKTEVTSHVGAHPNWVQFGTDGLLIAPGNGTAFRSVSFEKLGVEKP